MCAWLFDEDHHGDDDTTMATRSWDDLSFPAVPFVNLLKRLLELSQCLGGIGQVGALLPGCLPSWPALPADQELSSSTCTSTSKNLFDFIFF